MTAFTLQERLMLAFAVSVYDTAFQFMRGPQYSFSEAEAETVASQIVQKAAERFREKPEAKQYEHLKADNDFLHKRRGELVIERDRLAAQNAELVEALRFYATAWKFESKELRGNPVYNQGQEIIIHKSETYPAHDLMDDCGNKARAVLTKHGVKP